MVNLERICKDFARITSENVDPGKGSVKTARITCDSVEPGGAVNQQ